MKIKIKTATDIRFKNFFLFKNNSNFRKNFWSSTNKVKILNYLSI